MGCAVGTWEGSKVAGVVGEGVLSTIVYGQLPDEYSFFDTKVVPKLNLTLSHPLSAFIQ